LSDTLPSVSEGSLTPRSQNPITFEIEGPGVIVATDNGDPTNFVPFHSHEREAFNGLALVIIRSKREVTGSITVTAKSPGLKECKVVDKMRY
jgi:beta-galactosidase